MNMSPAVIIWWKEVRSILPVWAGTLLAVWLPTLFDVNPGWTSLHSIQSFAYLIGSLVLAATVYAREFQDRTMIWQLLQPVSRMSVLLRKGSLLLVALMTLGVSYFYVQDPVRVSRNEGHLFVGIFMLLALVSVCFWGLLLRNFLGATVVSLAAPVVLFILFTPVLDPLESQIRLILSETLKPYAPGLLICGLLTLYLAATGFGALFLWRRLQLPGDAVTVSQVDVKTISRFTGDAAYLKRTWWWTLIRKEVALLRFVFWVGGALVAGSGAYVVADRLLDHLIQSAIHAAGPGQMLYNSGPVRWQNYLFALRQVLFPLYLALVPALCGALAFCEETHFGNRAWQLCQPAHRTGQWLIKLGVAAGLSAVFGLALPLVVCLVAAPTDASVLGREVLVRTLTLNVLLFSLSVWCASASRSTVMALVKTFLLVFVMFLANQNGLDQNHGFPSARFDWRLLAWPLSLIALAYTRPNFSRLEVPVLRWVLQIGGMALLTFGFACGVALW